MCLLTSASQFYLLDCNRPLLDGTADSARCTGLCAQCSCRSTIPAPHEAFWKLENYWKSHWRRYGTVFHRCSQSCSRVL